MLTIEEGQYIINLLVRNNAELLEGSESKVFTNEEKAQMEKDLQLSDSAFQKIITQMGSKKHKVSIANRVLIVDDISSMRSVLQTLIQSIGFTEVDTAKNGQDAWEILQNKSRRYGLVLSDWEMPGMTGLELLQQVRANSDFKEMPFVIISSTNKLEKVQQAIKEGVTDYLTKPISEKMLKDKLACYINKR